ncbi:hypothetical protein JW796_04400 [Candidatus Dojkabacteria bacterium]|nr:hypothetical protein [Candidatus Dojkabacteria bacterium]
MIDIKVRVKLRTGISMSIRTATGMGKRTVTRTSTRLKVTRQNSIEFCLFAFLHYYVNELKKRIKENL